MGKRVVVDKAPFVVAHNKITEPGSPPSFVPIIVESTRTVHAHQEAAELVAVFLTIHATVFSRALFVEKHEPRVGSYSSTPIAKELNPYSIFPRDTECIHFVTLHLRTIKGMSHLRAHLARL